MGWAKSASTGRRKTTYRVPMPDTTALREAPIGLAAAGTVRAPILVEAKVELPKRVRRPLPVYDVATGEDLETPVNLDNTLLQVMFPDLEIALGQVPPPPPRSSPEQVEAHWQAVLEDLCRDLPVLAGRPGGDQPGVTLDIATGARKEGRFMYTDGRVGRQVADTFEKIMAYGGLLASPCLRPPQLVENVRILEDNLVFGVFTQLRGRRDTLSGGAELLEQVASALRQDEVHVSLALRLRGFAEEGQQLIQGPLASSAGPEARPVGTKVVRAERVDVRGAEAARARLDSVVDSLRQALEARLRRQRTDVGQNGWDTI